MINSNEITKILKKITTEKYLK